MLAWWVIELNKSPDDFWSLTFSEWTAIQYRATGKGSRSNKALGMTAEDLNRNEEAWLNGNT